MTIAQGRTCIPTTIAQGRTWIPTTIAQAIAFCFLAFRSLFWLLGLGMGGGKARVEAPHFQHAEFQTDTTTAP